MSTRVLSIVPTKNLKGGGEKSFFELLIYMQAHGCDNFVIVPKNSEANFLLSLKKNKIQYILGDFDAFGLHGNKSLAELMDVFSILKIIQAVKPDVFITNLYIQPSQMAAALGDVPHIYVDRGLLGFQKNQKNLLKSKPDFIKYASAIICNSKNGQIILEQDYQTKSHLVYSYVEKPDVKLSNNKVPRIIMPANFFREKNHLDILSAIRRLKTNDASFKTEVVFMGAKVDDGNDEYFNSILNYIEKYKLGDCVKIVEYQDQPWNFFSQSDIYINSGEAEAVGRSTAEAEMLGITALIADIPGHWEHKALFGNEYSFKLHDINDLTSRIVYLLNPENQQKIKEHNKKVQTEILRWMTPGNTMHEIINVINTVKTQPNPARTLVYDDLQSILENSIAEKRAHEAQIEELHKNNNHLSAEIASFVSIKRSIRLAAGNIKRKLSLKSR